MLEPALRRKPVLMGPHTENFRESAALLEAAGAAVVVGDAGELGRELARLLSDAGLRAQLGGAADEAAGAHPGAVRGTPGLISRLLGPGDPPWRAAAPASFRGGARGFR